MPFPPPVDHGQTLMEVDQSSGTRSVGPLNGAPSHPPRGGSRRSGATDRHGGQGRSAVVAGSGPSRAAGCACCSTPMSPGRHATTHHPPRHHQPRTRTRTLHSNAKSRRSHDVRRTGSTQPANPASRGLEGVPFAHRTLRPFRGVECSPSHAKQPGVQPVRANIK
jgi:hypothetical protein